MRFVVIILVSLLGYSLADVLQVKCGDELCERPSNLAVTTLRYVPDKPYKLQINSLNSEVEIFGATDDLYYARYGRNYGFLPKNHIREKAKGNFIHPVQLNLENLRINAQVKETNFLHEILKSSSQPDQQISNETNSSTDQKQHNHDHSHNHEEKKVENLEERPTDYIPIGTEPKVPVMQAEEVKTENGEPKKEEPAPVHDDPDKLKAEELQKTNEIRNENDKKQEIRHENNDSGIEDEEDDDEADDEEEDDEEDEEADFLDSKEQTNDTVTQNPENVEPIKIEENKVELNATTAEEKPIEKAEDIKIAEQEVVQTENVVEQDKNVVEDIKTIDIGDNKAQEPAVIENIDAVNKTEAIEQVEAPKKPEKIQEIPEKVEEKPEVPEFKQMPEIKEETTEKPRDPAPVNEEIIEEPVPTQITTEIPIQEQLEPEIPPPIVETTTHSYDPITNLPEIKHEEKTEVPPSSQEKREVKVDQDLLLKRFNEKLGQRNPEGVGSVEQVHHGHQHSHSNDQHGHSHGHSHDSHSHESHNHQHDSHSHQHDSHSHQHDSQHSHSHDNIDAHSHEQHDAQKEDIVQEETVNQDKMPGFFSGLVKKIFGDEHAHHHTQDASTETQQTSESVDEGFCEKIDSENCPKTIKKDVKREVDYEPPNSNSVDDYIKMILSETLEMMDVIITMGLVALTVLIFIFGHYCISKASKEGSLIRKMNDLERELMATGKENGSLKAEVEITKQQLKSIQDNSFGSNDMVIALKQDLEFNEREKEELLDKIASLEKELEAAAEDGLELNRMVSELLNNQTGSDSIISSVEDLQRQLNEQQETIITMNEALAAKSRENSELQIQLSEINNRFGGEYEKFQQQVDAVSLERSNLQIELENLKRESDMQVNQIIEERNSEVTRLNSELTSYAGKYDENKKLLTAAESRVQALEECIDTIKKSKGGDFKNLLDVADLKADLLAVTKEKSTMQEQLQSERDSRKLLDDRVKTISVEMSNLKKEFSVAEKEKLDAQTRLDVLSNYFKDKETQLQSELSLKEARWMKQQGETTSTVEKVQALNAEIQTLKSQNDELKAEFEAQIISYKAKLSSVEGQSHTAWLAAKQSERKMEEARMEAAALRRRLTSIAENPGMTSAELLNGLPVPNDSINSIPSPMRVESPNNISLPQPPLMMPPFLPGAPPFLPPPFMPGDMPLPPMGLPPLGRLMSPPPKRFTPTMRDDRDRYSPRHGRYSPDSRYDDYTPFETETDISPPRSPIPQRRGYSSPTDRNKKSKGGHNSEQLSRRK